MFSRVSTRHLFTFGAEAHEKQHISSPIYKNKLLTAKNGVFSYAPPGLGKV